MSDAAIALAILSAAFALALILATVVLCRVLRVLAVALADVIAAHERLHNDWQRELDRDLARAVGRRPDKTIRPPSH